MKKRIGVLTSGGDCPGLNAGIRAVVRTAAGIGYEVIGIRRGWKGLLAHDFILLNRRSVSGIINRGGTILLTAREKRFYSKSGLRKAAAAMRRLRIEGLIVFGGNGSLQGAWELAQRTTIPILGVPKSIDNDVGGTDIAIGFDTAVNTAVEAIDRIRDTATSHERLFLVEVMGRKRGFLALSAAVASGAEAVLLPETKTDLKELCRQLEKGKRRGKVSSIVVVAEGDDSGGAFKVAKKINRFSKYEIRVSILGHLQRGGAPTAFDRILASQLGTSAVEALVQGARTQMVGLRKGKVILSSLEDAWKEIRLLNPSLLKLTEILSR